MSERRTIDLPWPHDVPLPEGFSLTNSLRWNDGVLEQMHQGHRGTQKWEPVPVVSTTN